MKTDGIVVLDIGTTAIKCLATDMNGKLRHQNSARNRTKVLDGGGLEQNPLEWWESASGLLKEMASDADAVNPACVVVTGQMSAPVLLDRQGNTLYPAVLIADTRSGDIAEQLERQHGESFIDETGNKPLSAFTVSKLLWLMENQPQAYEAANVFLLPKDYIRYRLTGEIATDPSDASNTLLLNYRTSRWNSQMIKVSGLAAEIFPEIKQSQEVGGYISQNAHKETGLPKGIPVLIGAADMACTEIGALAGQDNHAGITLSTSTQIMRHTLQPSFHPAFTCHRGVFPDGFFQLASIFSGGSSVDYMYRLLYGRVELSDQDYLDMQAEISQAKPSRLIYYPFITGSGSPYFCPWDKGTIRGLSPDATRRELLLSVPEGVCYNIRQNIELMDNSERIEQIYLGGGGSRLPFLPQMLADVLGVAVRLLGNLDASGFGACLLGEAYISGENLAALAKKRIMVGGTYEPKKKQANRYESLYRQYLDEYQAYSRHQ